MTLLCSDNEKARSQAKGVLLWKSFGDWSYNLFSRFYISELPNSLVFRPYAHSWVVIMHFLVASHSPATGLTSPAGFFAVVHAFQVGAAFCAGFTHLGTKTAVLCYKV